MALKKLEKFHKFILTQDPVYYEVQKLGSLYLLYH